VVKRSLLCACATALGASSCAGLVGFDEVTYVGGGDETGLFGDDGSTDDRAAGDDARLADMTVPGSDGAPLDRSSEDGTTLRVDARPGDATQPGDAPADNVAGDTGQAEAGSACDAGQASDNKNCGYCGHDCLAGTCTQGICQPQLVAKVQALAIDALAINDATVYFATSSPTSCSLYSCPKGGCSTSTAPAPLATVTYSGRALQGLAADTTINDLGAKIDAVYWSCGGTLRMGTSATLPSALGSQPLFGIYTHGSSLLYGAGDSQQTTLVSANKTDGSQTSLYADTQSPRRTIQEVVLDPSGSTSNMLVRLKGGPQDALVDAIAAGLTFQSGGTYSGLAWNGYIGFWLEAVPDDAGPTGTTLHARTYPAFTMARWDLQTVQPSASGLIFDPIRAPNDGALYFARAAGGSGSAGEVVRCTAPDFTQGPVVLATQNTRQGLIAFDSAYVYFADSAIDLASGSPWAYVSRVVK
jgi:hypothetical protein